MVASDTPPSSVAPPSEHPLVRAARFCALMALALSILVYPLSLSDTLWGRILRFVGESGLGRFLVDLLEPMLRFQFSPLTLKESVASWAMVVAIAAWAVWKVAIRPPRRKMDAQALCLLGLLVWLLVAMLRAPHFGLDSLCAATGFNVAVWALFALAMGDLPASERYARRVVRWLLALSLIVMAISVAQATAGISDLVFRVMLRHVTPYNRNLYGSLIGHNTGAASACLGPFFFALAMLPTTRRRAARIALGAYVLLAACFFIVTQSRSIWGLLLVLVPAFLWAMRRIGAWTLRVRWLALAAGALALFGASQIVPSPVNFLDIRPADYMSRIHGMKPKVILQGTRARVIGVSLPYVARKPIAGWGLGAFPVIFPHAQAEYFRKHPDSVLRMVPRQTLRAHNDYLQLLVEAGAVGLGLALAMAFFIARQGLRALRRADSIEERTRRLAAGFALLGIALHAFVDFPFHIAPLATLAVFYGALFAMPARRPTSEPHPAPTSRAAIAAASVLACGVAVLAIGYTTLRLQADHLAAIGGRYFEEAREEKAPNLQDAYLAAARERFRLSLRVDPLQYLNTIQHGQAAYGQADLHRGVVEAAMRKGRPEVADNARNNVKRLVDAALGELRRASFMANDFAPEPEPLAVQDLGPRLCLPLLYAYARTWRVADRAGIYPDDAPGRAIQAYRKLVYYRPIMEKPLIELLDLMQRHRAGTAQERLDYRWLLMQADYRAFLEYHMPLLRGLTAEMQYDEAADILRDMLRIMPDLYLRTEVPRAFVHVALLKKDVAMLREAAEEMRRVAKDYRELPLVEILVEIAEGEEPARIAPRLQQAYDDAKDLFDEKPSTRGFWLFVLGATWRKAGDSARAEALETQARDLLPAAEACRLQGRVLLSLFHDADAAMTCFQNAIDAEPPTDSAAAIAELARWQHARGDLEAMRRTLAKGLGAAPRNEALRRLARELQETPAP